MATHLDVTYSDRRQPIQRPQFSTSSSNSFQESRPDCPKLCKPATIPCFLRQKKKVFFNTSVLQQNAWHPFRLTLSPPHNDQSSRCAAPYANEYEEIGIARCVKPKKIGQKETGGNKLMKLGDLWRTKKANYMDHSDMHLTIRLTSNDGELEQRQRSMATLHTPSITPPSSCCDTSSAYSVSNGQPEATGIRGKRQERWSLGHQKTGPGEWKGWKAECGVPHSTTAGTKTSQRD